MKIVHASNTEYFQNYFHKSKKNQGRTERKGIIIKSINCDKRLEILPITLEPRWTEFVSVLESRGPI